MARKKLTRVVAKKPVSKPKAEPMAEPKIEATPKPAAKKTDVVFSSPDTQVPLTLINKIAQREARALDEARNTAMEAAKKAVERAFSDTPPIVVQNKG